MYKPKGIPAIRLAKSKQLPTEDEVSQCLAQAQKTRGRVVELPWRSDEQTGDLVEQDCILQCSWPKDDDEPIWAFFKGDAGPREMRWRHQTRDIGLIAMIAQRECLGAEADISSKDRLSTGNKRPGDGSQPAETGAPPPPPAPSSLSQSAIDAFGPNPGADPSPFGAFGGGSPMGGMPMGGGMAPMGGAIAPLGGGVSPMGGAMTPAGGDVPFAAFPAAGGAIQPPQPAVSFPTEPAAAPAAAFVGAATMQPMHAEASAAAQSASMGFATVEKKPARSPSMQGDLANMKAAVVLQSMVGGKMTGVLEVSHNEAKIEIFTDEGNSVHATAPDCKGESAIIEFLTWEQGRFQFFSDERTTERTTVKRLENILMESAPIVDQFRFLNQAGVTMDTYLIRKQANISEGDFEQRISRGAMADVQKQKLFYQVLDGQCNLFEVLRKMPLSKMDWIPCVYNLVVCDLVSVMAVPSHASQPLPVEAAGVDRHMISAAMISMYRQDTGLLSWPVVLYFMEQEFFRWEYTGAPFSVLIFDMVKRTAAGVEALPVEAVREAVRRIDTVKRNVDYLSHFEAASFLLFMPNTKVPAAAHVARRIADLLRDPSQGGELDSANLALAFGVAGVPEDCQDLGQLLAAGKQAVAQSKQTGNPVVTFQSTSRT